MDRMALFYKRRDNPVKPRNLFLAGRQAAAGFRNNLMGFQVRLFCVIERFEQCAFVNRRTGVTNIGDVGPDRADFFHEVRAMHITAACTARHVETAFSGTFLTT